MNASQMSGLHDFKDNGSDGKHDDTFMVTVKIKKEETLNVEVTPSMTVRSLKSKVNTISTNEMPIHSQVIYLKEQEQPLSNSLTLGEYGISGQSILILIIRPVNPVDIIPQLEAGTFEFDVGLPKDCGYPREIFMNLSILYQMSAFCVICHNVPRDAMELDCDSCIGKICKSCLEVAKHAKYSAGLDDTQTSPCPSFNCHEQIELEKSVKTRSIQGLIQKQEVKCNSTIIFKSARCNWKGTVSELPTHIKECIYQAVTCPFGCYAPNLCKGSATIDGHFAECPEFLLKCRHCSDWLTRREITAHERSCPEEAVPCKFQCGSMLARRNTKTHNEKCVQLHLRCMQKNLAAVLQKRQALQNQVVQLKKTLGGNDVIQFGGYKWRDALKLSETVPFRGFDPHSSSPEMEITEEGRQCAGAESNSAGSAGCREILSRGRHVFKIKILRQSSIIWIGFFPAGLGDPEAGAYEKETVVANGYFYGCKESGYIRSPFSRSYGMFGRCSRVGDILQAIIDFDAGTISFRHNEEDLGIPFNGVHGSFQAAIGFDRQSGNCIYIL